MCKFDLSFTFIRPHLHALQGASPKSHPAPFENHPTFFESHSTLFGSGPGFFNPVLTDFENLPGPQNVPPAAHARQLFSPPAVRNPCIVSSQNQDGR